MEWASDDDYNARRNSVGMWGECLKGAALDPWGQKLYSIIRINYRQVYQDTSIGARHNSKID